MMQMDSLKVFCDLAETKSFTKAARISEVTHFNFMKGHFLLSRWVFAGLLAAAAASSGCRTAPRPGALAPRRGDEIVVAGQFVHTGTRVVLWLDPGGYDAYRVERRFSPIEESDWEHSHEKVKDLRVPNRYNPRNRGLTEAEIERVRGGGWDTVPDVGPEGAGMACDDLQQPLGWD